LGAGTGSFFRSWKCCEVLFRSGVGDYRVIVCILRVDEAPVSNFLSCGTQRICHDCFGIPRSARNRDTVPIRGNCLSATFRGESYYSAKDSTSANVRCREWTFDAVDSCRRRLYSRRNCCDVAHGVQVAVEEAHTISSYHRECRPSVLSTMELARRRTQRSDLLKDLQFSADEVPLLLGDSILCPRLQGIKDFAEHDFLGLGYTHGLTFS
jgi:hypothetical protein